MIGIMNWMWRCRAASWRPGKAQAALQEYPAELRDATRAVPELVVTTDASALEAAVPAVEGVDYCPSCGSRIAFDRLLAGTLCLDRWHEDSARPGSVVTLVLAASDHDFGNWCRRSGFTANGRWVVYAGTLDKVRETFARGPVDVVRTVRWADHPLASQLNEAVGQHTDRVTV